MARVGRDYLPRGKNAVLFGLLAGPDAILADCAASSIRLSLQIAACKV